MNRNTAGVAEDSQISIEDALKNSGDLSTQSTEDLKSFFDEYKNGDDFLATAALATELGRRSTENLDATKNLAEEAMKEKEFNAELITEKEEQNTKDQDKVAELTAQLSGATDKISNLEETVNKLLEAQKENREETSQNLEDILEAKKSGDPKSLNQFVTHLEELLTKKGMLKDDSKKELLRYPDGKIRELRTRRIGGGITKFGFIKLKNSRKFEAEVESLKIVKNIRSRGKINKTIRKFNKIKDNPKEAVKYIMSKTNKRYGGMITASFKRLYNHLTIRDTGKFDEVFNKQKKQFIDDLFGKIGNNATDRDNKIKESIIKRIDYYQNAYKKTMITV